MNVDVLQRGVDHIHEYIAEYMYTRTKQKGIAALDVNRDLYDARTNRVRPFLNVLASKVVALYKEDLEIKQRLQGRVQTARQFSIATPAVGAVIIVVGVSLMLFMHWAEAGRELKNLPGTLTVTRVLWEVFTVMGSISLLVVLSRQARADAEVTRTNAAIDLREQVPYTHLLWDPAIRLVHYNGFTDQDQYEAELAKDPNFKAMVEECDTPPQVGYQPSIVAATAQGDQQLQCNKPTTFKLTPQYLSELRQWIVDFYDNREEITRRLQAGDSVNMTKRLARATDELSELLRVAPPATMATADAEAFIDRTVTPLVISKVARFADAVVVGESTAKPYAQYDNLGPDECIDRCLADAPRCGAAATAGTACRLYDAADWPAVGGRGGGDSGVGGASAVLVPDRGGGAATVFTRGALAATDARRTRAFISQLGHASLKECAAACGAREDCGFCTKQAGRYFMGAAGEAPGLAADGTAPCEDDCYYFKNTATTAPDLNSDRIRHLASKLATAYMTNGILPDAAHDRVLQGAQSALSPTAYAATRPLYEQVLSSAKEEYVRMARGKSSYADDGAFVTRLSSLSKADFISQLLVPVHEVRSAVKSLQSTVTTQERVERLRSDVRDVRNMTVLVNAVVLVLVCLAFVGWYMAGKDWFRMSAQTRTLSVLQFVILTLAVIFFIILVTGYNGRRKIDAAAQADARQKATKRLQATATTADAYIDDNMALVSKLLGRDGLSRDPYTGRLLDANKKPIDLRDAAWAAPVEAAAVGDDMLVFASELRSLIVVMHRTVNDCSDILGLRPTLAFPWNEVMLSALGIFAIYVCHVFMARYLMPGELVQKLRMLARRAKFDDFGIAATVDDAQDFAAQVISMLVVLVVLVLMMYSSVYSTNHYRSHARSACDRRASDD